MNLAQLDPNWGGTGALFRDSDLRDWHLELEPNTAEVLAESPPPSCIVVDAEMTEESISAAIGVAYDQDGEGACVAYSSGGAKSIEDFKDERLWRMYDAEALYRACGGTGQNGISTDRALRYIRDYGLVEPATGFIRKIQGYAFAPQVANAWRLTLASALVANGPCVVAMLLPSVLGWDSNEIATSGYHQLCFIAYDGLGDNDHAIFLNSWGRYLRIIRVKWHFLEGGNFQSRHVYGYQLIDVIDFIAPPPPPPPPPPDPNHHTFAARVLLLKPGKIVAATEVDLPNLHGRQVTVNAGALQFQARIKNNDEGVVVLKGEFNTAWVLKDAIVQIETIE